MINIFSYRLFIWTTCFGTFFWRNCVFFIYKYIYLYCNLQWNTFWFDTLFPIKWCWKTTYKRKPETINFGWNKLTQDSNKKNTCQKKRYCIYMDMAQNEVSFFGSKTGFFERKQGHLILRQPPHTHTLIYIYI